MSETMQLRVNGETREVTASETAPLLYVLRNDLGLKGSRFGCGQGLCGACVVLVDGKRQNSCDLPLWDVKGKEITTIEGIGKPGALHAMQEAIIEAQAAQCGYCVSGIIVTAVALLDRNPDPTDTEIKAALDDNLCRCGTHIRFVRAVKIAARRLTEQQHG